MVLYRINGTLFNLWIEAETNAFAGIDVTVYLQNLETGTRAAMGFARAGVGETVATSNFLESDARKALETAGAEVIESR